VEQGYLETTNTRNKQFQFYQEDMIGCARNRYWKTAAFAILLFTSTAIRIVGSSKKASPIVH
jgi:hypothetical protein